MTSRKPRARQVPPDSWETIFALLSLDGVTPLYEYMGLELPNKDEFVALLRRELGPYLASTPSALNRNSLVKRTLRAVEEQLGAPAAERLLAWAKNTFFLVHTDQPQWSAWDLILPHSEEDIPRTVRLSPTARQAIAEWRASQTLDEVEGLISKLREAPLTEWDAAVYSRYNFSNTPDPYFEDDFIDPYGYVLSTAAMNRLQSEWKRLTNSLSKDEKESLWEFGKQFLINEEIEMPEPLRHPDELEK